MTPSNLPKLLQYNTLFLYQRQHSHKSKLIQSCLNSPKYKKMQILKTGIIYDPRMLDHKARRKHPETPQRIKVIINVMEEHQILSHPKIQYIPSVHRLVLESELGLAHQQKYINFCRSLWPKSGHRADITVLDTYFNEKSEEVARIATGCLLEGIDNLLQGKWQNGFAVIRPPGHHSGAKSTINGFCIYNNIAIGANYILEKWKKQRVAILDWDVHHGDGTQHIMQQNQKVLFISIHRYDRGTFYPAGDEGSYQNNGQLAAKGTKLNIPLDFVDQSFQPYNFQAPGDNDYIYTFHRIVEPVLREFNPDVILISSGFDAAFGDPLGGFTVTPNGYHYLTKKVLQLKKPTLVALQGGYSLDAIKNSAYGVIKALINEQPPEQHKNYLGQPIKQAHLKQLSSIHPVIHQQLDTIIDFHSQFWNCLKTQQLLNYTQKIKGNLEKCYGIIEDQPASDQSQSSREEETKGIDQFNNNSRVQLVEGKSLEQIKQDMKRDKSKPKKGNDKNSQQNHQQKNEKNVEKRPKDKHTHKKHDQPAASQKEEQEVTAQFYFAAGHMQRFKNFSLSNQTIHKWSYEPQIVFFESSFEQKKYAPVYFGREGNYVIIENLLFNKKPPIIVMDIKMSRQSKNPFISEQKRQKQKRKQQKSTADKLAFRISGYTTQDFKQGGIMTYSQDQVKKLLKIVVDSKNKTIFSEFIQKMIQSLSQIKRKYWGTSIVLIKSPHVSVIRWIDFHYYIQDAEECDGDLLEGLQNLKNMIQTIE